MSSVEGLSPGWPIRVGRHPEVIFDRADRPFHQEAIGSMVDTVDDTRRHHLLLVLGTSPDIVLETLHAVNQRLPTGEGIGTIEVLTTVQGRSAALQRLFSVDDAFKRFLGVSRPPVVPRFRPEDVRVICDPEDRELDDVRSTEDSAAVANELARRVAGLTSDPGLTLHASLAGGRKTMGALLALAMVLYGRSQDRLYHVLASPEIEREPDRLLEPEVRWAESIALTTIPFPRLTEYVPPDLKGRDYADVVERLQASLDRRAPHPVAIDVDRRTIRVGNQEVVIPPQPFALIVTLVWWKLCAGREHAECGGCSECGLLKWDMLTAEHEATRFYAWVYSKVSFRERSKQSGPAGFGDDTIYNAISTLRRKLKQKRLVRLALFPDNVGSRKDARYALPLQRSQLDKDALAAIGILARAVGVTDPTSTW